MGLIETDLWRSGSCHQCSPESPYIAYTLLCCPSSRYWDSSNPEQGPDPTSTRVLLAVCRSHLLVLPDQAACSKHPLLSQPHGSALKPLHKISASSSSIPRQSSIMLSSSAYNITSLLISPVFPKESLCLRPGLGTLLSFVYTFVCYLDRID